MYTMKYLCIYILEDKNYYFIIIKHKNVFTIFNAIKKATADALLPATM